MEILKNAITAPVKETWSKPEVNLISINAETHGNFGTISGDIFTGSS